MNKTPRGMRLHIAIFGKRNVGKSSLLNALTNQDVAIVSDTPGTTTDPIEKQMEFLPIGPVQFIDTAGIDDEGDLGLLRVDKSKQILDRADIALLVIEGDSWGAFEEELVSEFSERKIPFLVVSNKSDKLTPRDAALVVSTKTGEGILELKEAIIKIVPDEFINTPSLLGDIITGGDLLILVVPIDKEAPKNRLILPQVQTIRDILDNHSTCLVLQETELKNALANLKNPPKLVITDSQAFEKVSKDTPEDILLTSFSILFARFKGDLSEFAKGAKVISKLKPNDKVLICEACSHHQIEDDIGRVKIPNWLNKYVGGSLQFTHYQGHDFPKDLTEYKLVIHCGSCMQNRKEMLSKIVKCNKAEVPITNYGITISYLFGICERALAPFPDALKAFNES